ncbi:MAG: glycosyltransferase family 4 protein [Anaerolineales bacterium]|nr:glycosyltransferase family 4 protein [Anaerolineales bacterium]
MRLGIVTGEFPPLAGGVGDYSQQLAQALAAQDVDVHVLTDARCAAGGAAAAGYTLHPVVRRWSFPALGQIRSLARALRLDWLNIQYQAAAYGLGAPIHFLPDVAGVPSIVTFHDLRIPYLFPKAGRLRPWAVSHLARAARGAVATDAADEAELRRRGVGQVTRIPIGSNIAPAPPADYDRAAWRARWGVQPADFLLGYFGFLNHSKGGDTLIRALAALAERKTRVKLILIGGEAGASDPSDAAFAAQLERLISRHGLEHRILRTGFVAAPEVSAHLLACDALALPYRDGVSLRRGSLMAALAHGCAVISTTPAAPLPELRDGENVRLVPADSPETLVLAVSELLNAPALRARLGLAAQATAAQFRWDGLARRLLAFLAALG